VSLGGTWRRVATGAAARRGRRLRPALALGCVLLAARAAAASDGAPALRLVAYAETADGARVAAEHAGEAINPASVVKLATTLWALERLGAAHRFETRVASSGVLDPATGVLAGDLHVRGGADPDFHVENALLVAEALNGAGVREVRGDLVVDDRFWIGWEGGAERREGDADRRARAMAERLRRALDPATWSREARAAWRRTASRRVARTPPEVHVRGARRGTAPAGARDLVVHRSNPLAMTLKRLNVHSNNDIERLGATLGPPAALAAELAARWDLEPAAVRLDTLSGLGRNRLPVRAIGRLLAALEEVAVRERLDVADLVAVSGCDAGTLRFLPGLADAPAGSVIAKTGTLTVTDGGVTALAGWAQTAAGPLRFVVAVPRSGARVEAARRAEARWLQGLAERHGGLRARPCGARAGYSDDDARAVVVD